MSGINIIRRWVIQSRLKEQTKQGGVMITLPKKEFVDLNTSITADRLLRSGIDIDQLTSVAQVENLVNRINKLSTRVISQDDPRFKGIMDKMMGKRGEVVDMEGKKIPPGSRIMGGKEVKRPEDAIQDLVDQKFGKNYFDEDVPPGSRGGEDDIAAPVQSAEESLKNMVESEVDKIIKNIKRLDPIDSMKEANKIIKREDYYKNLSDADAKRILEETEDHIFQRDPKPSEFDPDPEDFAKGGIARIGLKEGLTPEQQGSMGPVFTTSDPKEAAKEVIKRLIKIEGADIPVSDKLRISLQGLDKATVQGVMKILGGELSFGAGKQGSDKGIGFNFSKSFQKGGIARIGLKDGMNRRTFLKFLGGAISLPIIGRFFKPVKGVDKVSKVPMIKTGEVPGKPEWFDQLVNRVIMEGDDVTKNFATKDREIVHMKKIDDETSVRVTQDLDEDTIMVDIDDPVRNVMGEQGDTTLMMRYKKGRADEETKGTPPDEFDVTEADMRNYMDGPDDYVTEFVDNTVTNTKDLTSDLTKIKSYATGKNPTMKELVESKKRRDAVKYAEERPAEYAADRGPQYDYGDEDIELYTGKASGGIAKMLGE